MPTSGPDPGEDRLDDLAVAHDLADAADAITTSRFGAVDLSVATKPDLTPVTDADRAVEAAVRRLLAGRRPADAVLGEEEGGDRGVGGRQWVVDPVDGTKNFVRGVPVWATLIALRDDGEVTVGVVSAPALGRRWWASLGGGAFTGRSVAEAKRCQVSAVSELNDAFLCYSGTDGWAARGDGFERLLRSVWRTRAFGDFWSHMLVAEGAVDVAPEPAVALWDVAPAKVIVEEAGGRFSDLEGRPGPDHGTVLTTNGLLHEAVLAVLAGRPPADDRG